MPAPCTAFCEFSGPCEAAVQRAPGADVAQVQHVLRAVGVVQIENRSLRKNVGPAQARLMIWIAFNLDRTVLVAGRPAAASRIRSSVKAVA